MKKILSFLIACLLLAAQIPALAEIDMSHTAVTEETEAYCDFWEKLEENGDYKYKTAEGSIGVQTIIDVLRECEGDGELNLQAAEECAYENGCFRELSIIFANSFALLNKEDEFIRSGYSSYRLKTERDALNDGWGFLTQGIYAEAAAERCTETVRHATSPSLWTEERFQYIYGTGMSKFLPVSPYAGFCLITVDPDSEGSPTHPYTESDKDWADFTEDAQTIIGNLEQSLRDAGLHFTGNPDTASVMIRIKTEYPFYAYYGNNRNYAGYDTDFTVTAVDIKTGKSIAEIKAHNRLGNTVSVSGTSGKVWAKVPSFTEEQVAEFTGKIYANCEAGILRESAGRSPRGVLAAILAEKAAAAEDPWQQAIYAAGAEDIAAEENTLTFNLRAYSPVGEEMPDPAEDPEGYLEAVAEAAGAYAYPVTVTLKEGELDEKGVSAIASAVKKAAAASKKAWQSKEILAALTEVYFPQPAGIKKAEDLLTAEIDLPASDAVMIGDAADWAILFYSFNKFALDVNNGPEALTLTATGTAPEDLLEGAADSVLQAYAKQSFSNQTEDEEIDAALRRAVAERCLKLKKSGKETLTLDLALDDLARSGFGETYEAYMGRYTFRYAAGDLELAVRELPDYAAVDFPANGILSGKSSGTKVVIKAPADGKGHYVQIRRSADDERCITMFVHSGKSVSCKVPRGSYYLLLAEGVTWYGEEGLFGTETAKSATYDFDVPSSDYYLELTITPVSNGDLGLRSADMSEFFK